MSQYIESERILLEILSKKDQIDLNGQFYFNNETDMKTWYSCLTDYTLREYIRKGGIPENSYEIDLTGNNHITDQGIIWMCHYLKDRIIKKVTLKSCNKLTEISLFALLNLVQPQGFIDMSHTNVKYIPENSQQSHHLKISNCVIGYHSHDISLKDMGLYSLIIWPSKSVKISGIGLIGESKLRSYENNYLEHKTNVKICDTLPLVNILTYRFTEVPTHLIVPKNPGQVIVVLSDNENEACNHLVETVAYFLASEVSYVPFPKISPPSYQNKLISLSDNRIGKSKNLKPQMQMKKMSKSAQINLEDEHISGNESLLEHDLFLYRNISVEDSVIKLLHGSGSWVSKIPIDRSHSVFQISTTNADMPLTKVAVGFHKFLSNNLPKENPDTLFVCDFEQSMILYNKNNTPGTYQMNTVFSCKTLTIKSDFQDLNDTEMKVFFSIEKDGTIIWSTVFLISREFKVAPFIIINQLNRSIVITQDWAMSNNRIILEDAVIVKTEPINVLKFVVLCTGTKCQEVYKEVTKLNWSEKLASYIKKLKDLILNIKKKDPEFIDFSDCKRLSSALRQMEQFQNFMSTHNSRLSIHALEKIEEKAFNAILTSIKENIMKDVELQPFKFSPNILVALSQNIIDLGKRYVTFDLLSKLSIIKNEKVFNQVCQKMFSEGKGIFIEKLKFFLLDLTWFDSILNEIMTKIPFECDNRVMGVHRNASIWTISGITDLLKRFNVENEDNDLWIEFFMELGVIIRLPCIRNSINDELYMYVNPMIEGTGKKPHLDYILKSAELIDQKVEVKVKYIKIAEDLYSLYPQLLSKTISIGQVQLISPIATVCHISGGVELIIQAGEEEIFISAYTPLPLLSKTSAKFKLNLINYLWNVLFLYTDALDALLSQQNILSFKILNKVEEPPTNYSICYSHKWSMFGEHNNICSLCGNCSSVEGINCPYNRINSQRRGICLCLKHSRTCSSCGICTSCAKIHWESHCETDPSRLITLDGNENVIPNNPISVPVNSKFIIDIFDEISDLFFGLVSEKMKFIIDIFGVTDANMQHAAITIDSFTEILSPIRISTLSFTISELYFDRFDLYQFSICSGISVVQELGILTYENEQNVGIVVGQLPITRERNRFSIEILNPGKLGRITLGVVKANYPLGQPGWFPYSYAYHGDDGGIFIGGSQPVVYEEKFSDAGNRIEAIVEFEDSSDITDSYTTRHITWKKNGEYVFRTIIESTEDLYPAIGMQSACEQVKLIDDLVWKNDELLTNEQNNQDINTDIFVNPKKILCLKTGTKCYGLFYIVSHSNSIKLFEFKVTKKKVEVQMEHIAFELNSFDHLKNTTQTNGTWTFENDVTTKLFTLFTFELSVADLSNVSHVCDCELHLTITTKSGEKRIFQWDIFNSNGLNDRYVKEVPSRDTYPTSPSYLLTTTYDKFTEMNPNSMLNNQGLKTRNSRYYHIPRDNYRLQCQANKRNAWIRCQNFAKTNFTRSFQIGNILSFNTKPSVVVNANKTSNQIKVIGYPDPISYDNQSLEPLSRTGKSLLALQSSKDEKNKYFRIVNKPLLSVLPPSRPWLLSFNWKNKDLIPISDLYFANECNEYYGINISLLNLISGSEEENLESKKPYHVVALPFNQEEIQNILFEHSLMNLISWKNILFYPLCAGKSSLYEAKLHIVDIKGIQAFDDKTPGSEGFQSIFLNTKLLDAHKSLLNFKFILPQCKSLLPKASNKISKKLIEFLIFSILEKITNYMLLNNLLCDDTDAFHDDLNINWNIVFEADKQHSLVMDGNGVSCKLHSTNFQEEINLDELIKLEGLADENENEKAIINNSIFEYAKCSQSVIFSGKLIKNIPEELFTKFRHLNTLELRNMFQLEVLPKTIYNLKGLQRLIISSVGIRTLPEVWRLPNLKYLEISECPITDQEAGKECKKLQTLKLLSLPLKTFPSFMCLEDKIITMELQLHGLQTLPIEFKNLRNLKELKIIGSPLYYELDKNKVKNKLSNLEFSYQESNIYSVKDKKKTGNNLLPAADVFINVPRIGSGYSVSTDIINHGGFPSPVLHLKHLTCLVINHHSFRYVPSTIEKLEHLETLDLSFNFLLERIPAEIGFIKSMKKITLNSCPSLIVPPLDVIARGSSTVLAFLKYLLAKTVVCNRTKLMFVGLGEAGKTSLLYALISPTNSAQTMIQNPDKIVTDGIDIAKWTVIVDGEEIQYSTWDFAGQDVYYNTHQFFLSPKAIYIIVWSVRQGVEHGDLDFWLSSICCHAKDAPIFVVGTRCDQVQADTSSFNSLKQRYPQIVDFQLVDSFTGTGIMELKQKLLERTLDLSYMHQEIPSTILELEAKIIEQRNIENYMTFEDFEDIASSEGIFKEDVKGVIQVLHDFGSLQYFDTEMLKSYIVINPQWIVDIMAKVVSIVNPKIKNGIFYHNNMKDVWDGFDDNLYLWMLNLTEEFDLTYPHPTMVPKANIVPCLLSEEEPEIIWPTYSPELQWKFYQINYEFVFLPAGLFNRVQVRLFDFTETKVIWKYGTYFEKNGHHVLLKREKKNSISIRAVGVRPVNVLAMVDDVVKGLIKTSFFGVNYHLEISCPDCIEYGNHESNKATNYWSDISMISSNVFRKALIQKVEYLQCSELHLNSIKSMKENTPETTCAEDFIEDLMSKVQTVKGFYASTEKSITMIYSEKDFNEPCVLSMKKFDAIFDESNLLCFKMSESRDRKWKLLISNSDLCLICLSENIIYNPIINEIIEYIIIMRKKSIVLILSADADIRQKWEYYPFFMNVYIKLNSTDSNIINEQFNKLNKALLEVTSDALDNQPELESYDCFISYCWSNSQDAVNKGAKNVPGAIVCPEADPRHFYEYLQSNGITCWIDEKNMKKTSGINVQLSQNLIKSKMMVAFVSNEYNESSNCKMELNFMVEELKRPVIFVMVGLNSDWRYDSEIGLIMKKKEKTFLLDFTKKVLINEKELLENVQLILKDCNKPLAKRKTKTESLNVSTAFIEQVELISRQFLNQLLLYVTENCPRIVILDIYLNESKLIEHQFKSIINDAESLLSLETSEEKFESAAPQDSMYIKVICENEGGWHVVDDNYKVFGSDLEKIIEDCAVYLYMIYQVFEYKNPGLACLQTNFVNASQFISKITMIARSSRMSFQESYSNMIKYYMKYDKDLSQCSLKRYRLPSGRELWMCDKDAADRPRCKLIERDAATIESMAIPVDESDKILLTKIKSKLGSDLLNYSDSFRDIVNICNRKEKNRNVSISQLPPATSHSRKFFRRDTMLNLEQDIVTNTRETYIVPIRLKNPRNSDVNENIPKISLNRRVSTVVRENLLGSRVCLIQ